MKNSFKLKNKRTKKNRKEHSHFLSVSYERRIPRLSLPNMTTSTLDNFV